MATNTKKNMKMPQQAANKTLGVPELSASPADGKGDIQMYIQSIKETIVLAVQRCKYKNGMFESLISPQTSILTDLQLLSCSVLTTAAEKSVFKGTATRIRSLLDRIAQGERETDISSSYGYFADIAWLSNFSDVFEQDMHASGQYVPPTMIQIIRPDGTVRQTATFESSSGPQIYEGGVAGIPPGAPPGFDNDIAALLRDSKAEREAHSSTHYDPSPKNSKPSSGSGNTGKDDQKGSRPDDFGIDFKENLKRAFH